MPSLSIVIPSIAFDPAVEQTLVSVLQNRPEYSEVIVVTSRQYDDPYGLGREVRFLTESAAATRLELINLGCREARGAVVHLLLPGVLAVDGWTDRVLRHFTDRKVAAVSPVLMPGGHAERAAACGVSYSAGGSRQLVGAGMKPSDPQIQSCPVLAPVLCAGFFCQQTLAAFQGFDCELGEPLADVEIGLAFRELGLATVVEPQSRVIAEQSLVSPPRTFEEALRAERLFRRQATSSRSSRTGHALLLAVEFLAGFPRPRMITRLCGRMAARRGSDPRPRFETRLAGARAELQRPHAGMALQGGLRRSAA